MVRAGYKQTEVGVIPEDWEVKPLGFILKVRHGKNQQNIIVADGMYPILASGGEIGTTNTPLYSQQSVLIGRKGTIDKPQYQETPFWTIDTLFYTEISSQALAKFVYYKFCSINWYSHNEASGVPSLNANKIQNIKISIPLLKEQTAIATALSDIDALITTLTELIDKKRQIKTATMQQLLTGKQRLAGFGEGKGMKSTELGEIPEDWAALCLKDIVICLDNLRIPLNDKDRLNIKGDIPYCGANGIVDWINKYIIDDDIILMAEDGGYFDEYSYRPIAYRIKGKCWVNNHAHILKANSEYSQEFIYQSLKHKNILRYLASGTRAKLNKAEMWKIEIICPNLKLEQQAIAQVLSDMDDDLNTLETRLTKTKAIKQGMMQELLTGRTRLI